MKKRVLLYGATGFSGRLIAAYAQRRWASRQSPFELVLGGRSPEALASMGAALGLQVRAFGLDDSRRTEVALAEPGVFVVINAAGPFAWTGMALAQAALRAGCHYVDINGEADVYKRMDDLGYFAEQRGLTLVAGAGHSATTSDLMLAHALDRLRGAGISEVGTARIVFSQVKHLSRGSAQTAWRSVREQVVVMREGPRERKFGGGRALQASQVPTGQIERSFNFGELPVEGGAPRRPGAPCIATAVTLLDLFTARLTVLRSKVRVKRIEAYIAMSEGARIFVQLGALAAPLLAAPGVRRLVQQQVNLLPEGPDANERKADRHSVLLEIDDGCGQTLFDWRIETPDLYDFTANCVVGATEGLLRGPRAGWCTPAEMFEVDGVFAQLDKPGTVLAGCRFVERVSAVPMPAALAETPVTVPS